MKKLYALLRVCVGIFIVTSLTCAPTYRQFLCKNEIVEIPPSSDFVISTISLYDTENVLKIDISIKSFSKEDAEIEDIILTDKNSSILYPLSPEGVGYAYLGDPPSDFTYPLPQQTSPKKFIVTGHIREFPRDYYTGEFEVKEQPTYSNGSIMTGYLMAEARHAAQYKAEFQKIVYNVSRVSFNTDKVYSGMENKGRLYFKEFIFYCPLSLEIRIKKSDSTLRYRYKIYPQNKK